VQITRGAATVAALTYDAGGNLLTDNRASANKTYTYNKRNRLATATVGALSYPSTYNGREQLSVRQKTTAPVATTHFVHDIFGNVIAETSGTAAGTTREYIWLPETEIAPTREAMSQVDRPLAVVNGVGTAGVAVWNVSVDHLNRPVLMTNATKVAMWTAVWQPWGGAHSVTGTATLDTRFPGQWYQSETGLHYNWHRSYDPTMGRYTQPDPLGFVDGPSVYGYAGGRPQSAVDPAGLFSIRPQSPPSKLLTYCAPQSCTCRCTLSSKKAGELDGSAEASGSSCPEAKTNACTKAQKALNMSDPHHARGSCTDSRGKIFKIEGSYLRSMN
jgi:RHS repeat-associated protein